MSELFAGRYELGEPVGSGGMGDVLSARDTVLDRVVAVKLLAPALAQDADLRARFEREARLVARLSHPGIVTVFDAGIADDVPFIVMELVAGTTLAERIANERHLPAEDVRAIGREVALALAYAHAQQLVHRDVKPANILLPTGGGAKLGDFGIARAADTTRLTQAGTLLGTAVYLSPEQLAGEEATAASDVYALGVCLYEALAGRLPREGSSLVALAQETVVPPLGELADVPEDLEELVMRCLARRPEFRPGAAELVAGLRDPAAALTLPLRRPRPRPHHRKLAFALIGALLLASLGWAALAAQHAQVPETITHTTRVPERLSPPAAATTPADEARALAVWLREQGAR